MLTIIMVLGESGLGKSTLIDSLFLTDLYLNRKIPRVSGEFLILSYTVVHVQQYTVWKASLHQDLF